MAFTKRIDYVDEYELETHKTETSKLARSGTLDSQTQKAADRRLNLLESLKESRDNGAAVHFTRFQIATVNSDIYGTPLERTIIKIKPPILPKMWAAATRPFRAPEYMSPQAPHPASRPKRTNTP